MVNLKKDTASVIKGTKLRESSDLGTAELTLEDEL